MGLFDAMLPNWASKPRLPGWATPPGLPGWATPPGMAPRGGAPAPASVGGQAPGSVLGGGAGMQPMQPLSSLASGALGQWGANRRYGAPGMPGGMGGYGYGAWGGTGGQPGAAMPGGGGAGAQFYNDPALGAYGAAASNAAINAANPGGANPDMPYHQGWETNPAGGYIAGVGNTLAPGRSVTQADADRMVGAVKGLGASDEWIRDFLQRNPNDYSRLTNVWHDEFSGGMGDSNDPRTAGQFLTGGTPSGGGGAAGGGGGAAMLAPGGTGPDTYANPYAGGGAPTAPAPGWPQTTMPDRGYQPWQAGGGWQDPNPIAPPWTGPGLPPIGYGGFTGGINPNGYYTGGPGARPFPAMRPLSQVAQFARPYSP